MNEIDMDWVTDRWWANRDGTAISRNELIAKWYVATPNPKPEAKLFRPELQAWSGLLGDRAWVQDAPRVAELARTSPNTDFDEPDSWNGVSRLYRRFGDGLARFTATLTADVVEERPKGLSTKVGVAVRDMLRGLGKEARAALLSPTSDIGDILDSEKSARRFLQYTQIDEEEVRGVIRRAAILRIRTYLQKNRAALPIRDIEILEEWIDTNVIAWGDPGQPPREPTPDEEDFVNQLLEKEVADPRLRDFYFGEKGRDLLGPASLRARKTLLKWTVEGRTLTHAGLLRTAMDSQRTDQLRRLINTRERSASDEMDGTDPAAFGSVGSPAEANGFGSANRRDTARLEQTLQEQVFASASAALAAQPLASYPDESWEKQIACRILDDPATVARLLTVADSITVLVIEAWGAHKPAGATCSTATQSAKQIEVLLRMVLAQQIEQIDDHQALVGHRQPAQTWRTKNAEVAQMLDTYRKQWTAETRTWTTKMETEA